MPNAPIDYMKFLAFVIGLINVSAFGPYGIREAKGTRID